MRHVVMPLVAVACLVMVASASQTPTGNRASAQSPIGACAVLTRELVEPLTANKSILDLMAPEEEAMPSGGTACHRGSVRLQLFVGRGGKREISAPGLQPISGAGDGGVFRSNRNRYAEMSVWTAKHSLDLQVSVPSGGTAEALKPQMLALANAILAKLP